MTYTELNQLISRHWQKLCQNAEYYFYFSVQSIKQNIQDLKKQVFPTFMQGKYWAFAMLAANNTSAVCVALIPIILSSMSVLSALPVLSYVFPHIAISKGFIGLTITVVSLLAGYFKYQELVEREELDDQIRSNKQTLDEQREELERLKAELAQYNQHRPGSSLTRSAPILTQSTAATAADSSTSTPVSELGSGRSSQPKKK